MPDPIWYFAYGSNMNERIFRERRHMTPIETRTARLDGYRLRFAVAGRRKSSLLAPLVDFVHRIDQLAAGGRKPGLSAPADIAETPGERVWGVLYLLPLRKFARLDASEGRQYTYLWVHVEEKGGQTVRALTYHVPNPAPEGPPRVATSHSSARRGGSAGCRLTTSLFSIASRPGSEHEF
jgi:cation transport regulator ChaC